MVILKLSIYYRFYKISCFFFLIISCNLIVKAQPGSVNEPVRFIGNIKVDFSRPDGALPPVIGAHSYQVLRSVKENKDLGDGLGFTFHHAFPSVIAIWIFLEIGMSMLCLVMWTLNMLITHESCVPVWQMKRM